MDRTRLDVENQARAAEGAVISTSNGTAALKAAIKSAELYMQALRLADTPVERKRLDAKCKELLATAERLKLVQDNKPVEPVSRGDSHCPVSSRPLTTREQIILLEGSKLNGFVFREWDKPPTADEFALKAHRPLYSDTSTLPLSLAQLEIFGGWKRPDEALPLIQISRNGKILPNEPSMGLDRKIDLVQDLTSDCSVVASLCAGTSRAERGHSRLMGTILYPYDFEKDTVVKSANGKYVFRLYFNGCWRRVDIDDFLPTSKTSRLLHVIDRSHPGLLWPALIEKAYLKVRGGYDFPGSNSGTDLAVLIGWIPQQVFLHDEDVEADQLWDELFQAFNRGNSLLTIGTGKLPRREQKQLGLAAEHDYAVLEMKEDGSLREMLIKNPWADGDVWKGATRRKPNPNHESTPDLRPIDASDEMLPGTFWMDFNSVFQYFENMYINWNPGIFAHRQDLHFSWQLTSSRPTPNIFDDNPQFAVGSTKSGEIWLLLNRHFRTGDYTQSNSGKNGYISLYLYNRNGHRVFSSEGANTRGSFVDSPNTLLRFSASANTTYTAVVVSQDLPVGKHSFTLSTFSRSPASLREAQLRVSNRQVLSAAWTRSTAGGNSDSSNYLSNPQFRVDVGADQQVALVLRVSGDEDSSAARTEVHVKVLVVFSDGKRISRLRSRDVVAHSGDYRRGSAVIETTLNKGKYSVICSTFDENQLAKFTLDFYSSVDQISTIARLPAENSGRLSQNTNLAVFEPDIDRLLAPLRLTRVTKCIFIARRKSSSSDSSLFRLSLEQGQGPYKKTIADSGFDEEQYHAISAGVRLADIDLQPSMHGPGTGGLWLVLERLSQGSDSTNQNEILQVELLAEEEVDVDPWGTGNG